jgi:hypothetical protein
VGFCQRLHSGRADLSGRRKFDCGRRSVGVRAERRWHPRYRITFPAYTGYTYEVYGNPTFADLGWSALPFSLTPTGTIDRNKHTVASDGTLTLYVEAKSAKGFYCVSFRVPGANTGTP